MFFEPRGQAPRLEPPPVLGYVDDEGSQYGIHRRGEGHRGERRVMKDPGA